MELEHGLARHVCPVVMGRIVLLTSKKNSYRFESTYFHTMHRISGRCKVQTFIIIS